MTKDQKYWADGTDSNGNFTKGWEPTDRVNVLNKSKHPLPSYQTEGSAGMDLTANLTEPMFIKSMGRILVPTGIFIALPKGYEAQIRPRSGMAFKRGLTVVNAPGTIDSDYRGEIMVALINLDQHDQTINDGDRIAQMIIAKYETITWNQVESLDETVRGTGGFNSTGTNVKEKSLDITNLDKYSAYLNTQIDKSVEDMESHKHNELLKETKSKIDEYIDFLKGKK